MKNKTVKFLLKIALLFPAGFLICLFINGLNNYNLVVSIILGLMFSFGTVFWNLFDYEKYDEISYEDFLESTHTIILDSTDKNWNTIKDIIKNRFLNLKITESNAVMLKTEIERKYIDSILTAKRTSEQIVLRIERKYFKYLPDGAGNYRILKKISKELASNTARLQTIIK